VKKQIYLFKILKNLCLLFLKYLKNGPNIQKTGAKEEKAKTELRFDFQ